MKILNKILHLKIKMFGDNELENKGKILPCIKCGKKYLSRIHYRSDGEIYDTHCSKCMEEFKE